MVWCKNIQHTLQKNPTSTPSSTRARMRSCISPPSACLRVPSCVWSSKQIILNELRENDAAWSEHHIHALLLTFTLLLQTTVCLNISTAAPAAAHRQHQYKFSAHARACIQATRNRQQPLPPSFEAMRREDVANVESHVLRVLCLIARECIAMCMRSTVQ